MMTRIPKKQLDSTLQVQPTEGAFVDGDKTKLDGIETGAEVNTVDSVNTKTGAVVLNPDDLDDTLTTNKFTTAGDISKLAGIEALADVTDTTNVTSAGALMDSELTDIASVKALNQGVATTDSPTFAGGTINGNLTVNTDTLFVNSANGRVGIGTTSPTTRLQIVDAERAGVHFTKTGSLAGTFKIYNDGYANIVGPGTSPTRRFSFYDQMGAGTPNNVGTPPFCNFNDTNTGIYFPDNLDNIAIVTGGTAKLKVDATGNTSPGTDSAQTLGTSSLYWSNTYTDKIFFNSTATIDGATAGKLLITGMPELATTGEGIVMKSPDGTRYKVTVANGGTIAVAAA